jgi:glycine cleavage system pyridoxal-binding protein P
VTINTKKNGLGSSDDVLSKFYEQGVNLRKIDVDHVSLAFDETKTLEDLVLLLKVFY